MAKPIASINLLRNERKDTLEHIIDWAVTVGRVLVVVVELVALAAFLYRFGLDNQLEDLNTKIKQEQAIVEFQKKNEDKYRNLQDRLFIASSFAKLGDKNVGMFKDVLSFAPTGMTFTNFAFLNNGLQIEANVTSVTPLSTFISKLKGYPSIETVSINKIENRTTTGVITVGISATFKKQGGINAISGN